MLAILLRLLSRGRRRHAGILLGATAAVVVIAGAAFAATQSAPFSTGLYWAVVTASTVGYGDVTPHNPAGRVVAVAVILTTIPMLAAAFALLTGSAAASAVRRILTMSSTFPDPPYRLVIGGHPAVPAIIDDLAKARTSVVLVADVDPLRAPGHVHVVRGDPTRAEVLAAARPQDAEQALVTGSSDSDVLVSTVLLRKLAPELTITTLVQSGSVREALRDLGVEQTISAENLIAHTLAKSLETPHAGLLLAQLVDSDEHSLAEVSADSATTGKPLSAVRSERDGLVLGLVHDGRLTLGIGDDPVIGDGDRLLVVD